MVIGMYDIIGFSSWPTVFMMSCFNFGSCPWCAIPHFQAIRAWLGDICLFLFGGRSALWCGLVLSLLHRIDTWPIRHTTGVKQETKRSKANQLVAIASQNPLSRVHPDDCSLYCQASTDLRNVCVYTIQHDYQPKPFLLSHLPYVGFFVSGTMNFGKL